MALSDKQFREEFKPLAIPSSYNPNDSRENKVIYSLAMLGQGSSKEVIKKLEELEPGNKGASVSEDTEEILRNLYDKGLIKGNKLDGELRYDLSKITDPNQGFVDPKLLAPGLG